MDKFRNKRLNLLVWFRLSRVYNRSIRESNQHLKQWGLTAAQFDVLIQVGKSSKISQQELAEKLFVTKGNITQLLEKMERMQLITRKQEWRTKYLQLTDEGKKLFEQVVPMQEQFQADQFAALTSEEKKQLITLLKKLQH